PPRLEKQSGWEEMTWRAEVLAAWSRAGHDDATDALGALTATKLQQFWYPGYVQKCLATSGGERVRAKLKEIMPKAHHATIVRGLEQSYSGADLVALTGPYLADPTVCYVTTRKAGREALALLLQLAEKGNLAAVDALGVIGGPAAVKGLRKMLATDEPHSSTAAFRAADALGALLAAAGDRSLLRRHAAVLFLGHIGGPKVAASLKEIVENDPVRLVRAAAADGLEQIGTKDASAAAAFRKADAGPPPLV